MVVYSLHSYFLSQEAKVSAAPAAEAKGHESTPIADAEMSLSGEAKHPEDGRGDDSRLPSEDPLPKQTYLFNGSNLTLLLLVVILLDWQVQFVRCSMPCLHLVSRFASKYLKRE